MSGAVNVSNCATAGVLIWFCTPSMSAQKERSMWAYALASEELASLEESRRPRPLVARRPAILTREVCAARADKLWAEPSTAGRGVEVSAVRPEMVPGVGALP